MLDALLNLFELLPVILAVVSAGSCALRYQSDRRRHDRMAMMLAITASVLLIVAQTSWWASYVIQGNLEGTVFANAIWTIFNSITMLVFIIMAAPWRNPR